MARKVLCLLVAILLVAVPASAAAGKSAGERGAKAKAAKVSVAGVVKQVRGSVVTIAVKKGTGLKGRQLRVDLSGARLKVRDSNGDGRRDVRDLRAGDRMKVKASLSRDGRRPATAKRAEAKGDRQPDKSSRAEKRTADELEDCLPEDEEPTEGEEPIAEGEEPAEGEELAAGDEGDFQLARVAIEPAESCGYEDDEDELGEDDEDSVDDEEDLGEAPTSDE